MQWDALESILSEVQANLANLGRYLAHHVRSLPSGVLDLADERGRRSLQALLGLGGGAGTDDLYPSAASGRQREAGAMAPAEPPQDARDGGHDERPSAAARDDSIGRATLLGRHRRNTSWGVLRGRLARKHK